MQQPAYWAVPSGSNPAGTVTVSYAGAAGTQLQNPGQVQVWIHPWLFKDGSYLLTFTRVTKFSNENYFRFYVRHQFFIGQMGAPRLKLLTQMTNIQLREQARNLWKEILQS